uniref:Triabin n=1 Tax=Triatoma dimidiata TaxID=72491 RepID=D1MWD5_TRIDM|nr:hypothetical protein Td31 similar to pallidipin-like salivary lipocalin [Triatoma dimidiata]
MKTFIALTFIGIQTYAFAEKPSKKTECNYKAMENFDSTRYLQINRAFVTHSREGTGAIICRLYKTQKSGDKTDKININIYEYFEKRRDIYYSENHCNTTLASINKGTFVSSCKEVMLTVRQKDTKKKPKPRIIEVYTSVIDTDYDKYIIHYRCVKTKSSIKDNIEVLQTNKNAGDEPIKQALKKNGLEL